MPTHAEERWLPYPPEKLYDLVADVERYPEFLPWCVATRLRSSSEDELLADMVIGFKGIREKFTTWVSLDRPNLRIHVSYEEGPFKCLNNHWYFKPADRDSCVIDFFVDFEFRSRILQKMMALLFNEAVRRMVGAFEARANAQFGSPDPSVQHQP